MVGMIRWIVPVLATLVPALVSARETLDEAGPSLFSVLGAQPLAH